MTNAVAESTLFTSGAPTGVCCCGADMDDHSGWDNHSPLDQARYGDNNDNPILVRIRDTMDAFTSWETVLASIEDEEALTIFISTATHAHIKQAKRVVRKLIVRVETVTEETP